MDQSRFDRLTRALAGASTRRAGLRAALGGLLGTGMGMGLGLAALPAAEGEARTTRKKKRTRMPCSAAEPCPAGMACLELVPGAGQCICAGTGQPPCGIVCCGSEQTCRSTGDGPRCMCDADGSPACGGACCTPGDICVEDRCQACGRPSDACRRNDQCCAGLSCERGRCCQPLGAGCFTDGDCCEGRCIAASGGNPGLCAQGGAVG